MLHRPATRRPERSKRGPKGRARGFQRLRDAPRNCLSRLVATVRAKSFLLGSAAWRNHLNPPPPFPLEEPGAGRVRPSFTRAKASPTGLRHSADPPSSVGSGPHFFVLFFDIPFATLQHLPGDLFLEPKPPPNACLQASFSALHLAHPIFDKNNTAPQWEPHFGLRGASKISRFRLQNLI